MLVRFHTSQGPAYVNPEAVELVTPTSLEQGSSRIWLHSGKYVTVEGDPDVVMDRLSYVSRQEAALGHMAPEPCHG